MKFNNPDVNRWERLINSMRVTEDRWALVEEEGDEEAGHVIGRRESWASLASARPSPLLACQVVPARRRPAVGRAAMGLEAASSTPAPDSAQAKAWAFALPCTVALRLPTIASAGRCSKARSPWA